MSKSMAQSQEAESRPDAEPKPMTKRELEVELVRAQDAAANLRERLDGEVQRSARLEERASTLADKLMALQADHQRIEEWKAQIESLAAERDALATQLAEVVRERDAALDAADVAVELENARLHLGSIQSELDDTLKRLERSDSEHKTMSALSRQQAKELIVVRRRVDELLASRWRKLGQKIGVAMVLPWEHKVNPKK